MSEWGRGGEGGGGTYSTGLQRTPFMCSVVERFVEMKGDLN